MTPDQVLSEFEKAGALLKGHFILSSGLHSDTFLQKALVFQDAKRTAKLCKALAAKVREEVKADFTAIVSPAVGGIVPGYEMGRQLGLPAMYVERQDGTFQLRRGFTLTKNQPVSDGGRHRYDRTVFARMPGSDPRGRRQARGRRVPDRPLRRQGEGRREVSGARHAESPRLGSRQTPAASARHQGYQTRQQGIGVNIRC